MEGHEEGAVMRTEYDIDQTEAIGKVLAELAFNLNEFPQDYSEHLRRSPRRRS
jgi:hypothetical protein